MNAVCFLSCFPCFLYRGQSDLLVYVVYFVSKVNDRVSMCTHLQKLVETNGRFDGAEFFPVDVQIYGMCD